MTTIDITAAASFAPRVTSTRLRLTARGRRVLAFLAAVPAIVVLSLAILSGGGALASSETGAPAGTFTEVTVMPGDTLWSIAESVAPDADPRDVVGVARRGAEPRAAAGVLGRPLSVGGLEQGSTRWSALRWSCECESRRPTP